MALVQSVNGYGNTIDRSVARPFGLGRTLFTVDPAYGTYVSGRYAPVTLSYQETIGAYYPAVEEVSGERPPEPDRGTTLVPQPQAGGKELPPHAQGGKRQQEQNDQLRNALGAPPIQPPPGVRAATGTTPGGTPAPAPKPGAPGASNWSNTAASATAGKQGLNGPWNPFAGKTAAQGSGNLPSSVKATLGPTQWLMDASHMEKVRDAAVDAYMSKNNEWARGKGVPLGIGGESKYKGISKTDQLAAMVQVKATPYTGPRPSTAGIPRGHPAYDRLARGELVQYEAFTPAFTAQSANNAYYDLGLWRGDAAAGEIANWKRTFNALGLYGEGTYPNLSSSGWGYYENAAMAEFMKIANSNPEAYQSVADLPKLRSDLLDQVAKQNAATAAEGGGGVSYPYTQRQTSTNVSISNLEDARETLRGTITDMIGRAPSDSEVRKFLGTLNNYERAHPTTTTTTTTYKDANNITVNSSGPNGDNMDPYNVVEDFAEKTGDYHAYQQLKYYQAISDIMGSPMGMRSVPEARG